MKHLITWEIHEHSLKKTKKTVLEGLTWILLPEKGLLSLK
jgi:hypothetical protein